MVILEALNALYGDCLLLRYPGPDGKERLWIIDGGPQGRNGRRKNRSRSGRMCCCRGSRRSRTNQRRPPLPVALGMVSHIDDDHINGIQKLDGNAGRGRRRREPAAVKFDRFWFNSFDKLVGPKPSGRSGGGGDCLAAVAVSAKSLPASTTSTRR